MDPASPPITQLLRDWASGSEAAQTELMPFVYDHLKSISRGVLRGQNNSQVTATALVHDLYLKILRYDSVDWQDRTHFFSFCARMMRQIVIDHARHRMAQKRNAQLQPLGLSEVPWLGLSACEYIDLDRALERLRAIEPDKARVVDLRVFLGCTSEETAEILGASKATVDRHFQFARAWLYRELRPVSV